MERWELIIVGAGPAGLAAGAHAARSGLRTLILDGKLSGGLAAEAPLIENYPGILSISGRELIDRMIEQCKRFGAEIKELEEVLELELTADEKVVRTIRGDYATSAVIIATGSRHKELEVPGEREFLGKGVSYCALCDGPFFKGKKVLVVGGGNAAAASALYLVELASNVKLVHRRSQLRADEILVRELRRKGVELLLNAELKEVRGDKVVKSAIISRGDKADEIEVDGVFIQVGEVPNSEVAKRAGVIVDESGYIIVDNGQRTNVPGVFAAGDVTNCPVKQVGTAVGQGIVAAAGAYRYVRRPYYAQS